MGEAGAGDLVVAEGTRHRGEVFVRDRGNPEERVVRAGGGVGGESVTPTDETSANNYLPVVSGRERQWGRDAQDGA